MNILNFYNRKIRNKAISYISSYAYAGAKNCNLCLEKGHNQHSAKQALEQLIFGDAFINKYKDVKIDNLIIFNNDNSICDHCIADLELKMVILEFED